ncbi:HAD-IA family hydrolase [Metabacillus arenae]|uniref:HAD-IA family hydrolase n=1 Tax=Metabacillus arenae TaxID=2771434 RepID=A0A926RUP9_9BACI|nr:HAD-IA family hydrolase [Metabacillus arenae]MBD1378783.1 HAD-IA family hydrolase [Metabacillus arenae]
MEKYILLDFDGTFADSKNVVFTIYNTLAEKHNFKKVVLKDVNTLKKWSIKKSCEFLNIPLYKLPVLAAEFAKLYYSSLKEISPITGMKEVLAQLDIAEYKLVFISSNTKKNIKEFLACNELHGIFNILCSNNIFGKDKIIQKFMKSHNLTKTDVLYVGDEIRDIKACKKSNIDIIWVEWGYDDLKTAIKEEPAYIAKKPEDILKIAEFVFNND